MPVTYWTSLVGSLALIGFPGFAGFFSKDAIIEAVHASQLPWSGYAYLMVLSGVFVTALYSFRMFFLVFHGKERMDHHTREHLHESPAVVTVPLILLAIPSVLVGAFSVGPVLSGDYFGDTITVATEREVLPGMWAHAHGVLGFVLHGLSALPVWLALGGVATAYYLYMVRPDLPARIQERLRLLHTLLEKKYYADELNQFLFAGGARGVGRLLWSLGDVRLIDGLLVNGTARAVGWLSGLVRRVQTGYLYHYAFAMILGLSVLLSLAWFARP
jgi:NADH-quinone oxidoreductase subunit L